MNKEKIKSKYPLREQTQNCKYSDIDPNFEHHVQDYIHDEVLLIQLSFNLLWHLIKRIEETHRTVSGNMMSTFINSNLGS